VSTETKTTLIDLYRLENPNIPSHPDGITSHEDLVGQWFSPNLDTALTYLRKSTQTFGREAEPVDGAQLVVAHIPVDQLSSMHVSLNPTASRMDVEGDNYIVPRDGSIPIDVIPVDEAVGDLRGKLGNLVHLQEAKDRVWSVLGKAAIS